MREGSQWWWWCGVEFNFVMTEENCLLVFYDTELSKETITQVNVYLEFTI